MNSRGSALLLTVFVLILISPEQNLAESSVSIFPIHIILDGAKPGECQFELSSLQKELRDLHFPAGWTIAVMCNPVRWKMAVQHSDATGSSAAYTGLRKRMTVVNGAIFREFPARYRQILAHELAHIVCNCSDEDRADKLARALEKPPVPQVSRETDADLQKPGTNLPADGQSSVANAELLH